MGFHNGGWELVGPSIAYPFEGIASNDSDTITSTSSSPCLLMTLGTFLCRLIRGFQ